MKALPYIGVTGVKTLTEQEALSDYFRTYDLHNGSDITGMIGYVIYDWQLDSPKESHSQGPSLETLLHLVDHRPTDLLPMIHYCTRDNSRVRTDIASLFDIAPHIAVQINTPWPHYCDLQEIRTPTVLQLPESALSVANIRNMVAPYAEYVDYMLVDPSMGRGILVDTVQARQILLELCRQVDTRLGIAGGLGPSTVGPVVASLRGITEQTLCVDATSKLRKNNFLDLAKTHKYIVEAAKALRDR